jgi:hypothetical protein
VYSASADLKFLNVLHKWLRGIFYRVHPALSYAQSFYPQAHSRLLGARPRKGKLLDEERRV